MCSNLIYDFFLTQWSKCAEKAEVTWTTKQSTTMKKMEVGGINTDIFPTFRLFDQHTHPFYYVTST